MFKLLWPVHLGIAITMLGSSLGVPAKGRAYYEKRGDIVWEVPTKEKVIALTFDDGPDKNETPQLLDLLKQYGVHATFFVIGKRAAAYPDIVKREVSEGHEVANHTYNHPYFNRKLTMRTFSSELSRAHDEIFKATGLETHYFRPPGGYYNEKMVELAKKQGYLIIMWSWDQDTQDWRRPGVKKIVNKVLNNAKGGEIVLFHDHVMGGSQTIDALKQILPELKQRGFTFLTVSELINRRNMPDPVSK